MNGLQEVFIRHGGRIDDAAGFSVAPSAIGVGLFLFRSGDALANASHEPVEHD